MTVTASNGIGSEAVQSLLINFARPPAITSGARFLVPPGRHSTITVTTSGTPTPRLSESGALPPGIAFRTNANGTATISGTVPTNVKGTYRVMLTATNGVGMPYSRQLLLKVSGPPTRSSASGRGYWYTTSEGEVLGKGAALIAPSHAHRLSHVVAMAAIPDHGGYYVATATGRVYAYGGARWYGSAARRHLAGKVVAISVTPRDRGYYLVTSGGNVFGFGDARFYGSSAGRHTPPVAAFGTTPRANGYWLVTTDGNIYPFGGAHFYGSPARRNIPPVVAFAATPSGHGYRVVTTKGNVFAFGNARFHGSSAGRTLRGEVTGFAVDF
ncbi:MAG: hypothetical protein ACRDZX_02070 [Acidimicrobiales bacterium]